MGLILFNAGDFVVFWEAFLNNYITVLGQFAS
jgi:hypothetical protein